MTLRYAHLTPEVKAKAVEKLNTLGGVPENVVSMGGDGVEQQKNAT